MRLSAICKQYTFFTLSVILLIGAGIHYWIFRETIHHTADETLSDYQGVLENYVARQDSLMPAELLGVKNNRLRYILTPDTSGAFFRDTVIRDPRNNKNRNFRVINFPIQVKEHNYRAEISLRTLGNHDHFLATFLSFICVFGLFVLFVFLLVHFFSRKIFIPFNCFMEELRHADLKKHSHLTFSATNIDEIKELHDTYQKMMERIQADYRTMKELSDNITHELQTPLTIMRSKIDLLLQQSGQEEESVLLLQSNQANINSLSRFNRSLMLLTRIGNHPHGECERIDLGELCVLKLEDYAEILDGRGIRAEINILSGFTPFIHEPLAEVLINNLLSNAIKYNLNRDGYLRILCTEAELVVENSFNGDLPAGNLFDRFVKNKRLPDSTGLGLAIVKAICDKFQLTVSYEAEKDCFRIRILGKMEG